MCLNSDFACSDKNKDTVDLHQKGGVQEPSLGEHQKLLVRELIQLHNIQLPGIYLLINSISIILMMVRQKVV